ncbi:hypothetical protein L3Q82_019369, partial [Scortum barcoo]
NRPLPYLPSIIFLSSLSAAFPSPPSQSASHSCLHGVVMVTMATVRRMEGGSQDCIWGGCCEVAERDTKVSGKSKGGGLIMYVNNRWCNPGHISVKTVSCCPDLELLAVSLRPYYLPREFSHVITVCVYIPPRADAATCL